MIGTGFFIAGSPKQLALHFRLLRCHESVFLFVLWLPPPDESLRYGGYSGSRLGRSVKMAVPLL